MGVAESETITILEYEVHIPLEYVRGSGNVFIIAEVGASPDAELQPEPST